ncbi:MAG: XTP/dITP diphosphatase [Eubacteriales bacterium]
MERIIFATSNEGKMKEIRELLGDLEMEVYSLKELGIDVDIEENGISFEENAMIKAKEIAKIVDGIVIADDSGLEVDALGKEPGIYSARYMGEDTSYNLKNGNILERLEGVCDEKRTARFVCAIACVMTDHEVITTQGTIEGRIGYEIMNGNGFGYDPIFYVPQFQKNLSQLTLAEKNEISHRGNALRELKTFLKNKYK